jgi:hypothetical protein
MVPSFAHHGRDFGREVEVVSGSIGNERLIANPSDDLKEGQHVRVSGPTKISSDETNDDGFRVA